MAWAAALKVGPVLSVLLAGILSDSDLRPCDCSAGKRRIILAGFWSQIGSNREVESLGRDAFLVKIQLGNNLELATNRVWKVWKKLGRAFSQLTHIEDWDEDAWKWIIPASASLCCSLTRLRTGDSIAAAVAFSVLDCGEEGSDIFEDLGDFIDSSFLSELLFTFLKKLFVNVWYVGADGTLLSTCGSNELRTGATESVLGFSNSQGATCLGVDMFLAEQIARFKSLLWIWRKRLYRAPK